MRAPCGAWGCMGHHVRVPTYGGGLQVWTYCAERHPTAPLWAQKCCCSSFLGQAIQQHCNFDNFVVCLKRAFSATLCCVVKTHVFNEILLWAWSAFVRCFCCVTKPHILSEGNRPKDCVVLCGTWGTRNGVWHIPCGEVMHVCAAVNRNARAGRVVW